MTGIVIGECPSCGAHRFPVPLWCDVCGSYNIQQVSAPSGIVAETTVVRHMAGRSLPAVRIGTIRLDAGAVVIARLDAALEEGSRVDVIVDRGAPTARPKSAGHAVEVSS